MTGAGAAANSIGLVLVGGMAIGTLFTLFVVPSRVHVDGEEQVGGRIEDPAPSQRGRVRIPTGNRRRLSTEKD